jgi:hypothetical protein
MNRVFLVLEAMPHLLLTVLLAMAVAGVVALLGRRTRRERACHSGWLFGCLVATVVGGSWVMYLVHR